MSERQPKSVSTRETILNVIAERNRLRAEADRLREALRLILNKSIDHWAKAQAREALGDTPDE